MVGAIISVPLIYSNKLAGNRLLYITLRQMTRVEPTVCQIASVALFWPLYKPHIYHKADIVLFILRISHTPKYLSWTKV